MEILNHPQATRTACRFSSPLEGAPPAAQQSRFRGSHEWIPALGPFDKLLAGSDDPHAELLAMLWGSRFDREHAQALLARQPQLAPGLWPSVLAAAERFDRLPSARQHRLRRLIVRHRGRWDNARHVPHPAD